MVQGATADGVAHPSDRSIAWEETKGGSSSQVQNSECNGVLAPMSPTIPKTNKQ